MSVSGAVSGSRRVPGLPPWSEVSPEREAHIGRVAALVTRWADRMDPGPEERGRWLRAAWLHDALRDARIARPASIGFDWPEELLHGPAAADRAAREGEPDAGVLLAVRYHSLGHPDWDRAGHVLYCADFLEPGRRFASEEQAELALRFPDEPDLVLRQVASWRVRHIVNSGWPLLEPTWRFWNALASPRR